MSSIVGAGPAGAVAATVLARAGVARAVVDRADFPARKLCGDTVNPGTSACSAASCLGRVERKGCASTACASPARAASRSRAHTRTVFAAARSRVVSLMRAVEEGVAPARISTQSPVREDRRRRERWRPRGRRRHDGGLRMACGRSAPASPLPPTAADRRWPSVSGLRAIRNDRAGGRLARTSRRRRDVGFRRDAHPAWTLHRRRACAGRRRQRLSGASRRRRRRRSSAIRRRAPPRARRRPVAARSVCGRAARAAADRPGPARGGRDRRPPSMA